MKNVTRTFVVYEIEVSRLYIAEDGTPAKEVVIRTQGVGPAKLSPRQARSMAVDAYGSRLPRNSVVSAIPVREDTYSMTVDDFIASATLTSSVDAH